MRRVPLGSLLRISSTANDGGVPFTAPPARRQWLSSMSGQQSTPACLRLSSPSLLVPSHIFNPCTTRCAISLLGGAPVDGRPYQLRHIPTLGSSPWLLLSYSGARRFSSDAYLMYQEGYKKVS
jgi:hypothetical protein